MTNFNVWSRSRLFLPGAGADPIQSGSESALGPQTSGAGAAQKSGGSATPPLSLFCIFFLYVISVRLHGVYVPFGYSLSKPSFCSRISVFLFCCVHFSYHNLLPSLLFTPYFLLFSHPFLCVFFMSFFSMPYLSQP